MLTWFKATWRGSMGLCAKTPVAAEQIIAARAILLHDRLNAWTAVLITLLSSSSLSVFHKSVPSIKRADVNGYLVLPEFAKKLMGRYRAQVLLSQFAGARAVRQQVLVHRCLTRR